MLTPTQKKEFRKNIAAQKDSELIARSIEILNESAPLIFEQQMIDEELGIRGYCWYEKEKLWKKPTDTYIQQKKEQLESYNLETFLYETQVYLNEQHDIHEGEQDQNLKIWSLAYVPRLLREGYIVNNSSQIVKNRNER